MTTHSVDSSRDLLLSEVSAPKVAEAIAYWRAKTPAGGAFPARTDIDPLEVPGLLGHLALIDVFQQPELRFRFRLFGTELVEVFRLDPTGKWVDHESLGAIAGHAHARFEQVVTQQAPLAAQSNLYQQSREHVGYEVVDLPLGTPADGVTMIMSCLQRV
ncbi:PAS domain-containing protein [Limimonas halophila]|uniref:PAS domain-containing protein n=1 Tax=Limimonas halophila TaxID=1082479 RepID=A0A1G7NEV5_9PROT|nr:PAS domain-containing protein [Limimonas halophila]SDF72574.1 PAS domain-containing protein [Limimonas halophila]